MSDVPGGLVVQWPYSIDQRLRQVRTCLGTVLTIFSAIDAAEMLSALPECEVERAAHLSALALLGEAEQMLATLYVEMDV